jgi:hypothetical protein
LNGHFWWIEKDWIGRTEISYLNAAEENRYTAEKNQAHFNRLNNFIYPDLR